MISSNIQTDSTSTTNLCLLDLQGKSHINKKKLGTTKNKFRFLLIHRKRTQ